MTATAAASAPRRIDLRSRLSRVKMQGSRQTCLAFAASAGHELLRGGGIELSPEFFVHAAMQQGAKPNESIAMVPAQTGLRVRGQCVEELWPYAQRRDCAAPVYAPSAAAVTDATTRRVMRHRIVVSPDVMDMKAALLGDEVAVIGMEYHLSARELPPGARIPVPDPAEPSLGLHAYLVAGYDDDARAVLLRNSYGAAWGDGGYGWLPYDFPDVFFHELWAFGL